MERGCNSTARHRLRTLSSHVRSSLLFPCAAPIAIRALPSSAAALTCGARIRKLLVANRGEIAIRIFRAARDLGVATVAVYTQEDADALHVRSANEAVLLEGSYLDVASVLRAASQSGADAVHPGYGFLSEDVSFVESCESKGLIFVGPTAATVGLFSDKTAARRLAVTSGVPVLRGAARPCSSPDHVRKDMRELNMNFPIMLKAACGGGGRGIREVHRDEDLDKAFATCASEAGASFNSATVFFEELLLDAKHIEVQIIGDGTGGTAGCIHLFERDCSVQLRRQKVIEMAPAHGLSDLVRSQLHAYALTLARSCSYRSAGTFEFLVSGDTVAFIEGNPRIQVEHTVTEEAVGVDLVQAQLLIASGRTLEEIGLRQDRVRLHSHAMQARVAMTAAGKVGAYHEPAGRGVRVDSGCFAGCRPSPLYDPLLAKVIVSYPVEPFVNNDGFELVRLRLLRALEEFHIGGSVKTNLEMLRSLIASTEFVENRITTSFLDTHRLASPIIVQTDVEATQTRAQLLDASFGSYGRAGEASTATLASSTGCAPVVGAASHRENESSVTPEGHIWQHAIMHGQIVSMQVSEGDVVEEGQALGVMLSMKMEHVVHAAASGVVRAVEIRPGMVVAQGERLLLLEISIGGGDVAGRRCALASVDLDEIRPDLAEVLERRRLTTDEARLEHDQSFKRRLEGRHSRGQRSARENIDDLVDQGSFCEVGRFLIAQQRRRRELGDLIKHTPADGLVSGIATINAKIFGSARGRAAVLSYDFTVLAGTQGLANHMKCDRMVELAIEQQIPMVWFCEGGGGRPGDTDHGGMIGAGLKTPLWMNLCKLSGLVPLVGLTTGRCFAGNAAILGCCDVIIATEGSNIGMAGPAMIEGGGLGVVQPEDVGPVHEQKNTGVVDIVVADESQAVAVAKQYLSYFQGPLPESHQTGCQDQRLLRHVVPENRLRVYDMRPLITTLVDIGSFLELRRYYGVGMITGLARIAGRPLGICANNPLHLGGAIDSDAALKASRFLKLCDAFGLPVLFLCDTPGFMVGLQSEATGSVRKVCTMFLTGASISVPILTIVTRKAYGLGGQAMFGGASMGRISSSVSWPSGEFGSMGLEGAVRLGYKKELEAARKQSQEAYQKTFDSKLASMYQHGKALNDAMMLELDDVIDPAESRDVVLAALGQLPNRIPERWLRRRPVVDGW